MMAVWVSSGALLLVVLIGASHGYPAKKGFNPGSHYDNSGGGKTASADLNWEASAPQRFDPSPSGPASKTYSKAPRPQAAQHSQQSYPQPSAPARPVVAYSSPVPYEKEMDWVVAPPSPYSSEELPSNKPAPSNVGPSASLPGPQYQGGELSHMEDTFEYGNSESETEELGYQQSPEAQAVTGQEYPSAVVPSGLVGGWVQYPYPYDFMFLTGQYPPGTVTHFSSSYEAGQDHWQDSHYIRDYYPGPYDNEVLQQETTFPTDFETPQSVQYPGQFDQSPQYSPAGGYEQSQVGY